MFQNQTRRDYLGSNVAGKFIATLGAIQDPENYEGLISALALVVTPCFFPTGSGSTSASHRQLIAQSKKKLDSSWRAGGYVHALDR